jgi:hypothetical protein
MKETGIDTIYKDFCHYGFIHSCEDFNFRDDGIICTMKVIELDNVVRLFICVNGQIKKTEILANYKKRGL